MLWTGNWCPAQRRKLAAYPQPHSQEGRREEHSILSPTPVFLNSPSPPPHPTLPQLLCLRPWDHFDLALVTAVRRTAETKQTQKNWNPPHISGLIYLSVDLSHWLPSAELATWLPPRVRGARADSLCSRCLVKEGTFKGKPAHSTVCSWLFTKTFRTYLVSVTGRIRVCECLCPASSPIWDTAQFLAVFSAEDVFPSFFIFKYWPNLKGHPQSWEI